MTDGPDPTPRGKFRPDVLEIVILAVLLIIKLVGLLRRPGPPPR